MASVSQPSECAFSDLYHDHGTECWPDHVVPAVVLDDVSRLSATNVSALHQVRTIDDICAILKEAHEKNMLVSVRGTKHSMGGHTLNKKGIVIDMQYINHIHYDPETNLVTAGTGALWADLILYLNQFAKAPRTLQSYCSFSIGGTLSVNAHGITTDYCLAESVVKFKLIKADGTIVECSRDSESPEAKELFGLCIGGYGLFGIIYDVTLKVKDNVRLSMDTIMTPLQDLPYVYDSMVQAMLDGDIEIKLARIDITNFNVADIYIFRKHSSTPTVSILPAKPKEMSAASRTMYKWFAGPLREIRFAVEHQLGVALDWSEVNDSNLLLYESAKPLAQLYSPWLLIDDTFILQEFFIPKDNFNTWIAEARKIVLDQINHETKVTLLNITIRFVHHDNETALPYSATPGGSYAFVFYYRLRRTEEAEKILEKYHRLFVDITLQEKGTFYLPYRHHYSQEHLEQAYPMFDKFCESKHRHDPNGRFNNLWWTHYGKEPKEAMKTVPFKGQVSEPVSHERIDELLGQASLHRSDSFRKLLRDPLLRQTFVDTFLVDILALANNNELLRMINTAAWDKRLKDDNEIYMNLMDTIKARSGPLSQLVKSWKQVRQLSDQRKELVRETVSVLSRVGQIGKIHSYASVGDFGKLILPLRKALCMQGRVWVAHDSEGGETDIGSILERGTGDPSQLGEFVKLDYMHIRKDGREFPGIPDGSVDLVTMNQGLHHLPPKLIPHFLAGVHRILRVGGCFITREHDLDSEKKLMPMLDCAHMVFNVLTDVSPAAEREEIRGFRSILEWRQIIESCGFKDTMVYEMQPHDPTIDIMMCFQKTGEVDESVIPQSVALPAAQPEPSNPVISSNLNAALNQIPNVSLTIIKGLVETLRNLLPQLQQWLSTSVKTLVPQNIPGLSASAEIILNRYINPILVMLERFTPLTDAAVPQRNTAADLVPDEIFLLVHVLRARSKKGGMFELALISLLDKLIGFKDEVLAEASAVDGTAKKPVPTTSNQAAGSSGPSLRLSNNARLSSLADLHLNDIQAEMKDLLREMPQFTNLHEVVDGMGLNQRGTGLIKSFLPETGTVESFSQWVTEKLDTIGWAQLKTGLRDVRKENKSPTIALMTIEGSAWNRAIMAILGSPSIQMSKGQSMMAGWVGLGEVVGLWKKAQALRAQHANSAPKSQQLSKEIIDELSKISSIKSYEGKSTVLSGVLHVVSAKYVVSSLTKLFKDAVTDVTQEANDVLNKINCTLDLSDIEPSTKLSNFRAGEAKFIIEYRSVPQDQRPDKLRSRSEHLVHLLGKEGHVDLTWHAQRDILNHYKLPEWMQVELVQAFGEFMNHTPWYRFPFMNVLKTYFDVLFKEVGIVAKEHGLMSALSDQGFMTDFVPGVLMTLILSQMSLLAIPCRKMLGDDYEKTKLFETLVVYGPDVKWHQVDARIVKIKSLGEALHILKVPTFKPFTEVLLKIARHVPLCTVLQISNNSTVQVKLQVPKNQLETVLKKLGEFEGATVNFDFNLYPESPNPLWQLDQQIVADVSVPMLIQFINMCNLLSPQLKVNQIYDFF